MISDWMYLVLAGLTEIVFAMCLKLSEGFTKTWPTVFFAISAMLSLYFMNKAMNSIPLGTVYAVWTGIGAAGVVIAGVVLFKDPISIPRMICVILLIASIIGLKYSE